jgi:hypothetical protein
MRFAGLIAAVALLAVGLAGVAHGERTQEGNIVVDFDGGITPHALPREGTAPVAVTVDSSFLTTDGADPPPQLRQIAIGINREGEIFDRGLPTCRVRRIQPATIAAARRICGGAIVGSGQVRVRVHLDNQNPFTFKGPLLVFNGERRGGERRLLAQVYGTRPPSAFVLTFKIRRDSGTFGTVIQTTLPPAAREWAYVTHFDMKLRRTYTWRGKRRSFISAGCPALSGFTVALFQFARAKFSFAGGRAVTNELTRSCRVR